MLEFHAKTFRGEWHVGYFVPGSDTFQSVCTGCASMQAAKTLASQMNRQAAASQTVYVKPEDRPIIPGFYTDEGGD